jgi:hypothetical protein
LEGGVTVLQSTLNAQLEEDCRGEPRLDAGDGADRLVAGQLAGIIELDQLGEALLKAASQSIGQERN